MKPPAPKSKLAIDNNTGNGGGKSNAMGIAYNEFTGTFLVGDFLNLSGMS